MRRSWLVLAAACTPLGACLLDLPTPTVDAGLDGSVPPDGTTPDGSLDGPGAETGSDSSDGMVGFDAGPCDGPCVMYTGSSMFDPHLLDNDGMNLYILNGSYEIDALNIANKTLTPLSQSSNDQPIVDLKVRSNYIYFTTDFSTTHNVSRCPSTGCDGGRFDYINGGTPKAMFGVDSDGTNLFFTIDELADSGGIVKCAVGSKCPSLAPLRTFDHPQLLVLEDGGLYWSKNNWFGVYSCALPQCAAIVGAMGSSIADIAVDDANMYWIENGGVVWRQPKGSSAVQVYNNGCVGLVKAIRTDGTSLYWLCGTDGVFKCPVGATNCTPTTLASNLNQGSALTVTNDSVYYATKGDHTIWRVPK